VGASGVQRRGFCVGAGYAGERVEAIWLSPINRLLQKSVWLVRRVWVGACGLSTACEEGGAMQNDRALLALHACVTFEGEASAGVFGTTPQGGEGRTRT
jgi:hypothetical protein